MVVEHNPSVAGRQAGGCRTDQHSSLPSREFRLGRVLDLEC